MAELPARLLCAEMLLVLAVGLAPALASREEAVVPDLHMRPGMTLYGIASWYGWDFAGKPMADGERFYPLGATAASRLLPLGTVIRVTNLADDSTIRVTVTDRGPYFAHRVLDLSLGAARRLHFVNAGLAQVRIEIIALPSSKASIRDR